MLNIKDVLNSKPYSKASTFLILIFILAALLALALDNYLLFHTLIETFSIIVSVGTYILSSRTYRYSGNSHLLFIGYSFLFLSMLTFLHLVTYYGMGIFTNLTVDEPTQFWIASKYMQSICILICPIFIKRKIPRKLVLSSFTITTAIIVSSILWFKVFPSCFTIGQGLTDFKIKSEYIISFIL